MFHQDLMSDISWNIHKPAQTRIELGSVGSQSACVKLLATVLYMIYKKTIKKTVFVYPVKIESMVALSTQMQVNTTACWHMSSNLTQGLSTRY